MRACLRLFALTSVLQLGMMPLREALAARPDDDFVISAPLRRKSTVRPRQQKKAGHGERLMAFAFGHPREILTALFLAGCGGAIAWNALVLQSAHHPAPLFNQREVSPVPAPAAAVPYSPLPPTRPAPAMAVGQVFDPAPLASIPQSAAVPPAAAPAPRLPSRSAIADMIRNGEGSSGPAANDRAAPPPAAPVAPLAAKAPAMRDPIGEMIRMGGPVPTPPANVGRTDSGDVVLSGQRALAKLGYGIKVDGVMGAGTRQAIERFEQDRRLPVTGEFGPRTLRELSALSGIPVQ